MEIIKIKDLSFSYPDTEKKVLDKINININEGEFILLIGESGGGKSTLLRQLKNEIGSPGAGNEWHHIVEQSQISKSGFRTARKQSYPELRNLRFHECYLEQLYEYRKTE